MARQPRQLNAELAPAPDLPEDVALHSDGVVMSEAWVRATAILLRGVARRDARLLSTGVPVPDHSEERQFNHAARFVRVEESICLTR
ncbi:MAG: hypothetical protein H7145_02000 [Akkermansiaceae bacterium]|nr:hypothetical protein [Armatimonadota bacterium]